ncbi:MAG: Ig-like domain-containing protein [Bacteroidota bacterium]
MIKRVCSTFLRPFVSLILVLGISLTACEQVKEDVLPEGSLEQLSEVSLFAVPGEPIVIDLLEGVNLLENATIQLDQAPEAGAVEILDKSLARYELPARTSIDSDRFRMNIQSGTESYERTFSVAVTTRVGYPLSEKGAVYDRGGIIQPGQSITVDVLANDAEGANDLEIEIDPAFGSATVTDDQKITYQADRVFLGLVDVTYKVSFPDGSQGRAIVRFAISDE